MSEIDDILFAPIEETGVKLHTLVNDRTQVDWDGNILFVADVKHLINLPTGHIIYLAGVKYKVTQGGVFEDIIVEEVP